jgi:hypothetical protein
VPGLVSTSIAWELGRPVATVPTEAVELAANRFAAALGVVLGAVIEWPAVAVG